MARFNEETGKARFRAALSPRPEDVTDAMSFFATRVTESVDGELLIRRWWKARGTPPVEKLILDDDFGFERRCQEAARYWEARVAGAAALDELVRAGYLAIEGEQYRTEEVRQGFTTMTSESGGGTSGSFDLSNISARYPARVKPPTFPKRWTGADKADAAYSTTPPVATEVTPLGVIPNPVITAEAIEALNLLEKNLLELVESGTLTPESKRLVVDQAFELIAELRAILVKVTTSEPERRGLIRRAGTLAGEVKGTLSAAIKLGSPLTSLVANAPVAITEGQKIVDSIVANLPL